jgi:succinate dehydrogenase / fumarate reductase cytochrome b subunit
MVLPRTTVGRKILMAVTGQMMILFVIVHLLGNTTIYFNNLNAYAAALHDLPVLLWMIRFFLFSMLCLHAYSGIVITLENKKAKPQSYAVTNHLSNTFAGRNMVWTGTLIGAFLVYHLLHFTFQVLDPAVSAINNPDALGRPDVSMMVVRSFQDIGIAVLYVTSVGGLLLHLTHGIQSSIQTFGLNNDRSLPVFVKAGTTVAVLLFLGYAAIPLVILMGFVK